MHGMMNGTTAATAIACVGLLLVGCGEDPEPPGPVAARVPEAAVAARAAHQSAVVAELGDGDEPAADRILFGDLHVHTTLSIDAFARTLPFMQGEGAHPPADACDFARFCSALDFFALTDHAEALGPDEWEETTAAIRSCNAVAGPAADPDLVAYVGWEWTQVGATPEEHYGHKNVIARHLEPERVPPRPISARNELLIGAMAERLPFWRRIQFPLQDFANRERYFELDRLQSRISELEICPEGIDSRDLPPDCHEVAPTPAVLFEKLAQLGYETLVIPHGTTWGFYTPAASTLDKQLADPAQHDPERQRLFEIYSGHGNSEEYRSWRAAELGPGGELVCPAPSEDYLPCCWRAGEIVRSRCADPTAPECERAVVEARANYLAAGASGYLTVPGTEVEDWNDCGVCRDCFQPAHRYRPAGSAQYALALGRFDDDGGEPERFRFGFLSSSDNHSARPGTGYKEVARRSMTDAIGPGSLEWRERLAPPAEPIPGSIPIAEVEIPSQFLRYEFERQMSFFLTGGLVAVHASGRDRDAIWDALVRREVYGTSGPRILLWFDLLDGAGGARPMGSIVRASEPPRFRVRAAGALRQRPGCPEHAFSALGPERLEALCRGECYHPGDARLRITRIEVVRVRPRMRPNEPIADLIEDPWRVIDCPADPAGCVVEFVDEGWSTSGREHVYYVRAVQEATPVINAGGLRCERDASGRCVDASPCYGDYRTPFDDDCLAPSEQRAWSSPIYVLPPAAP